MMFSVLGRASENAELLSHHGVKTHAVIVLYLACAGDDCAATLAYEGNPGARSEEIHARFRQQAAAAGWRWQWIDRQFCPEHRVRES